MQNFNIKNILFIIFIIIIFYIIYNIFFNDFLDTFKNTSKNTIVYNFSATWCGHCKNFQPIWDEFSKSLNCVNNIKAIDVKCDKPENEKLCNKFNIAGYPSVIIVSNKKYTNYNGPRTVNGLRKALNLDKSEKENSNKTIIYNFNTEWCGYSKKFQPIWDNFSSSLSSDELKNISAIDVKCDDKKNDDLCNKYDIPGYPYVLIVKQDKVIPYNGPRTVEGLRDGLNLNKPNTKSNKIKIYNFNTEWCGYSKQFQPIWNTFSNSIKSTDNVDVMDVKCDDNKNEELCKKFNIDAYPTVIIEIDDKRTIYSGPRTVQHLRQAINL
jgi:thiol-disulfide isomerase/thioredoxin